MSIALAASLFLQAASISCRHITAASTASEDISEPEPSNISDLLSILENSAEANDVRQLFQYFPDHEPDEENPKPARHKKKKNHIVEIAPIRPKKKNRLGKTPVAIILASNIPNLRHLKRHRTHHIELSSNENKRHLIGHVKKIENESEELHGAEDTNERESYEVSVKHRDKQRQQNKDTNSVENYSVSESDLESVEVLTLKEGVKLTENINDSLSDEVSNENESFEVKGKQRKVDSHLTEVKEHSNENFKSLEKPTESDENDKEVKDKNQNIDKNVVRHTYSNDADDNKYSEQNKHNKHKIDILETNTSETEIYLNNQDYHDKITEYSNEDKNKTSFKQKKSSNESIIDYSVASANVEEKNKASKLLTSSNDIEAIKLIYYNKDTVTEKKTDRSESEEVTEENESSLTEEFRQEVDEDSKRDITYDASSKSFATKEDDNESENNLGENYSKSTSDGSSSEDKLDLKSVENDKDVVIETEVTDEVIAESNSNSDESKITVQMKEKTNGNISSYYIYPSEETQSALDSENSFQEDSESKSEESVITDSYLNSTKSDENSEISESSATEESSENFQVPLGNLKKVDFLEISKESTRDYSGQNFIRDDASDFPVNEKSQQFLKDLKEMDFVKVNQDTSDYVPKTNHANVKYIYSNDTKFPALSLSLKNNNSNNDIKEEIDSDESFSDSDTELKYNVEKDYVESLVSSNDFQESKIIEIIRESSNGDSSDSYSDEDYLSYNNRYVGEIQGNQNSIQRALEYEENHTALRNILDSKKYSLKAPEYGDNVFEIPNDGDSCTKEETEKKHSLVLKRAKESFRENQHEDRSNEVDKKRKKKKDTSSESRSQESHKSLKSYNLSFLFNR